MGGIVGTIAGGLGRRKGEGAGGDREEHGYPRCLQIQRCRAVSKQTAMHWRLWGKQESVFKGEKKDTGHIWGCGGRREQLLSEL